LTIGSLYLTFERSGGMSAPLTSGHERSEAPAIVEVNDVSFDQLRTA
jgi:hypothetical protein